MYQTAAVYIAVFGLTYFGVEIFRRWSLRREMLDVPNERSSHTVPTPRGGGLMICLISLSAFYMYTAAATAAGSHAAFFAGAMIIAAVSLADDVWTLSPFVRIICHGFAAALTVWAYGGFGSIWVPFYGIVEAGFAGTLLAFLWIVWLINAYNFMDGIDGIAATQSITAGLGWMLVGLLYGTGDAAFLSGLLACSAAGFLMLNWQPAKIFMGDVGSAFLGYSFAVLPLLAGSRVRNQTVESNIPWIGILLVWFFVFDSVLTLLRRIRRGEKFWQPHREHIYQKLVIQGWSHSRVTILYGAASASIVVVLLAGLKNSWRLEWTVLPAVFLESLCLLLLWKSVSGNAAAAGSK